MKDENPVKEEAWQDVAPALGAAARFIWYVDAHECEIDDTLRQLTGLNNLHGRTPVHQFLSHIAEADLAYVNLAVQETLMNDQPYTADFRFIRPDGTTIWLSGSGQLSQTEGGERIIIGVNHDITNLRIQQDRADLVAAEMNHRIKNVYTVISSLFRASARKSGTKEELVETFQHRLQALTALNSVIMKSGDLVAALPELVETVLAPFAEPRLVYKVDDVLLNADAAQTIALLLNELTTNAIKYGGLAQDGRGIDLNITSQDGIFRLHWIESAGRKVDAPVNSNGFGMSVVVGLTASTFKGRPKIEWREQGLLFSCDWKATDMQHVRVDQQH